MGVQIYIPDTVVQAIRSPEEHLKRILTIELAVALYARGLISFGKARQLAKMGKYEFGRLIGERGIIRHYGQEELEDDLKYALSPMPHAPKVSVIVP